MTLPTASNAPGPFRTVLLTGWIALGLAWVGGLSACVAWREPLAIEAPVYLTALLLLLHSRAVQRTLLAIGPWRTALLGLFIAGLLTAQLMSEGRRYYPFVRWTMYSTAPSAEITYRRLVLTGDGGAEHPVYLHQVIPFRSRQAFYRTLTDREPGDPLLDETLRLLASRHPAWEAAIRADWRLYSVHAADRPVVPEHLPESGYEIDLRK